MKKVPSLEDERTYQNPTSSLLEFFSKFSIFQVLCFFIFLWGLEKKRKRIVVVLQKGDELRGIYRSYATDAPNPDVAPPAPFIFVCRIDFNGAPLASGTGGVHSFCLFVNHGLSFRVVWYRHQT